MLKSFRHRCLAVVVHCAAWAAWLLATPFFPAASAQNEPVRVIAFGAHPDDGDLGAGGLAAMYAALGFKVKFVSLTNGDAGHPTQGEKNSPSAAARKRRKPADASASNTRCSTTTMASSCLR
jgi:LmbE family N-acetylglucosaminyl deacetylase